MKRREARDEGFLEGVGRARARAVRAGIIACKGGTLDTRAADQAASYKAQIAPADAILVPDGYRAVQVVEGLNFPSSMAWDDAGRLYVLESHSVAVPTLKPKILRVAGSELEEVRFEGDAAPTGETAVGLAFRDGWLYLSHEEKDGTWGISRLRPTGGAVEAVVRGMPGDGDHWVNYLAFDREGSLYFGVGSATNSGVVSSQDPVNQKWLKKRPKSRDIACRDVVLTGKTFTDDNALTDGEGDKATTGAYQPYGESAAKQIAGRDPVHRRDLPPEGGIREPRARRLGVPQPRGAGLRRARHAPRGDARGGHPRNTSGPRRSRRDLPRQAGRLVWMAGLLRIAGPGHDGEVPSARPVPRARTFGSRVRLRSPSQRAGRSRQVAPRHGDRAARRARRDDGGSGGRVRFPAGPASS